MIPNGKQYKVWFLLTVISLLIVGCAPSSEEALDNVNITEPNSKDKPSSKPLVDHHIKNHQTVTSPDQKAPVVNPKDDTTQGDVVVADETESQSQSTDAKVYNVTEDYDVSNPTLMGFTMNDTTDQVLERFGKPLSESIMNDGSDPLQIYEYPGFIIGFNSANQIVFIEVNSSEVNPGLNDLHIGQTVEEARDSLGTPDSLNEYVMIYSSNNLIMKLDIDPNSNIIRSIKLFAE
jgi:DNA-binding protein Fis